MLDERTRFSLMLLAGGAVAVLVGWCAWIAVRSTDSAPLPRPAAPKVFRKTLMEGLRVTHGGVKGVEFIKCRTCRLEKRRQGVLTLGGMNVLVLEDLDVVIPPDEPRGSGNHAASDDKNGDAKDVVRRMGISDGFLLDRGLSFKFSGVRVSNLSVSRLEGSNAVVRVFTARTAKTESSGLALSGCKVVRSDGEEEDVRHARLKMSDGALRLEWDGGGMDIVPRDPLTARERHGKVKETF